MPAAMRIRVPEDYDLKRDACSYGYFLLAPNYWDVKALALSRVLSLPGGPVVVHVSQSAGAGSALRVVPSRTLPRPDRARVERQVTRMLRLDEPGDTIASFHRADPRWKKSGRGRLFRSPTFFEDVLKTVTSCNVQWPGTIQMNRRLCEVVGERCDLAIRRGRGEDHPVGASAFPAPGDLAGMRPAGLRARCRVGYRDARIVELARLFTLPRSRGGIDPDWFEDPGTSEDAIHEALLELPGIGPYAAANILQLLGRYSRLPLDTESVRHGRTFLGLKGSPAQVMKKVHAHFAPFREHAFRSYWFEMWAFYESKHGKAWTWERETTGRLFTAALLNK